MGPPGYWLLPHVDIFCFFLSYCFISVAALLKYSWMGFGCATNSMIGEISCNIAGTGRSTQQKTGKHESSSVAAVRETRRFIGFVQHLKPNGIQPQGRVFSAAGVILAFCLFSSCGQVTSLYRHSCSSRQRPPTERAGKQHNITSPRHKREFRRNSHEKNLVWVAAVVLTAGSPTERPRNDGANVRRHSSLWDRTGWHGSQTTSTQHPTPHPETTTATATQRERRLFSELAAMALSRKLTWKKKSTHKPPFKGKKSCVGNIQF